jgi:hypothetical protein
MRNTILLYKDVKDVKVVTYLIIIRHTNKVLARFSNQDVVIEDKQWTPKKIATHVFHALMDKFSAQWTIDVKLK